MTEVPESNTDLQENQRFSYWRRFLEENKENQDLIAQRMVDMKKREMKDNLTGLLNRDGLEMEIKGFVATTQRHNEHAIIFFFDLDDLKVTNDKFGHKKGDELLLNTAKALRKTFRSSDIIARVGGDEFCAITALLKKEEIEILLARLFEETANIKLSVGFSNVETVENFEDALNKADTRMYIDKNSRKKANGQ